MNTILTNYIRKRVSEYDLIDEQRRRDLKILADYVSKKLSGGSANLIFICTHNSRRSHMSQIWAQIAAYHNGLTKITTYSGGTEATAFNPRALRAIQDTGIDIIQQDTSNNPKYQIIYADYAPAITVFSKKYSDTFNPQKDYCAVMTCTDADESCPVVIGADERISLPYIDPKRADDTDQETEEYAERCRQVAREMFYAFSIVTK
jgi:arsenate reductase (thioredoxin)